MRINFYDAKITENGRIILAKEKGTNYEAVNLNCPQDCSDDAGSSAYGGNGGRTLLYDSVKQRLQGAGAVLPVQGNCKPLSHYSKRILHQGVTFGSSSDHTLPQPSRRECNPKQR